MGIINKIMYDGRYDDIKDRLNTAIDYKKVHEYREMLSKRIYRWDHSVINGEKVYEDGYVFSDATENEIQNFFEDGTYFLSFYTWNDFKFDITLKYKFSSCTKFNGGIDGNFIVQGGFYLDTFFPRNINGNFVIDNIECFRDCILPKKITGNVIIKYDKYDNSLLEPLNKYCLEMEYEDIYFNINGIGYSAKSSGTKEVDKNIISPFTVNSFQDYKKISNINLSNYDFQIGILKSFSENYDEFSKLKEMDFISIDFSYLESEKINYQQYIENYEYIKELLKYGYRFSLCFGKDDDLSNINYLTKNFQGDIIVTDIEELCNVTFPSKINGNLILKDVKRCSNLKLPDEVTDTIDMQNLETLEGILLPKKTNKILLNNLKDRDIGNLPQIITGGIELPSLKKIDYIDLSEDISEDIRMTNLKSAVTIICNKKHPGNIDLNSLELAADIYCYISKKDNNADMEYNGNIYFNNLELVNNLRLYEKINGSVFLNSLRKFQTLICPNIINGDLHIEKLTTLKGAVLPNYVSGKIFVNDILMKKYDFASICSEVVCVKRAQSYSLNRVNIPLAILFNQSNIRKR